MTTAIWTRTFWRATAERVIGTAVASLIALFGVGTTVADIDWKAALLLTASTSALTVLKAVLAAIATKGSPGFGTAEVLAEPGATGESSEAGPVEVVTNDLADPSDPSRDVSWLDLQDGVGRHREPPAT